MPAVKITAESLSRLMTQGLKAADCYHLGFRKALRLSSCRVYLTGCWLLGGWDFGIVHREMGQGEIRGGKATRAALAAVSSGIIA